MDNLTPMEVEIQLLAAQAARAELAAGCLKYPNSGMKHYLDKQDAEVKRLEQALERGLRCDDR